MQVLVPESSTLPSSVNTDFWLGQSFVLFSYNPAPEEATCDFPRVRPETPGLCVLLCTVQLHGRAASLQIEHPDSADFSKTTATNHTPAWKSVITSVSFSNENMDPMYLTTRRITLANVFC